MADARWDAIAARAFELADEEVDLELTEVFKEDAASLKAATIDFLSNIKTVYERILSFNELKKVEHKIREYEKGKGKITEANALKMREYIQKYKELRIQEDEFQFFISQLGKYQQSLNAYLGQSIKTIYLYRDSNNNVAVYELVGDISQAVYQDIASRGAGLAARFSTGALGDKSVFQKVKESTGEEFATRTYLETLARGEISRQYLDRNGMLILWKPQTVWKKMLVAGGAGDLGEAYLSFLMSDERLQLFHGNMEPDIDIFMMQGVALVDNISGLLKGDFSIDGVEYAAKAEGASMMGYRQVISLALKISVSSPEEVANIMKKEYKKIQDKEKGGKGRRNKLLADGLETTAEKMMKETITKRRLEIGIKMM